MDILFVEEVTNDFYNKLALEEKKKKKRTYQTKFGSCSKRKASLLFASILFCLVHLVFEVF